MTTDALAWVRVSTGSQDESSQVRDLQRYAEAHDIRIVKTTRLHGYSASKGEQEPALREAIEAIGMQQYRLVLVTDSSRLDRDEDLDEQAAKLLAIRQAGGDVVSITEEQFGKTDITGRLATFLAQYVNAQKSITVKDGTWRGIQSIMENAAWYGPQPIFWTATGPRYHKVARCTNRGAVQAVYEAVRAGQSLSSIARKYDTYPATIRKLIRTRANMTGVWTCRYSYRGQEYTWQHRALGKPPVDGELWHDANRIVGERGALLDNRAGRPVSQARSWISGLIDCPGCGGHLYVMRGKSLRCGGKGKTRLSCGVAGISLDGVTAEIDRLVISGLRADIYRYRRVSGNQGQLDEMTAELDRVKGRLAATDDDDEFDGLSARRKALREALAGFSLVPDKFEMAPAGETLADLWRDGDKRALLKAIMRHVRIRVTHAPEGIPVYGGKPARNWVLAEGAFPADTLIELTGDTCIRMRAGEPERWVLL